MPRARRRVLAALAIVLLGAAGVSAYLFTRSDPAADLRAARAAADRRDFKAAAYLLDKYLAARPADLDARLFAAQVARRRNENGVFFEHIKVHRQKGGAEAAREFELRCLQAQEGDMPEAERMLAEAGDDPVAVEAAVVGVLVKLRGRTGQMSRIPAGPDDPRVLLGRRATDRWLASRTETVDRHIGLVWRGRVRAAAGEYPEALADFRAVLAEDPAHFDARLQLGMTVLQADPTTALAHLRGLREVRPDDADVLTALAAAYQALGRMADARAVLTDAIERKPDDVLLKLELGFVELDANRPEEAEKWIRQVLARAPGVPSVYLAMSRCLAQSGNLAEAKKFQERYDELEILAKRPWRYPKQ